MSPQTKPSIAIVIPSGPGGKELTLDTLESVEAYCEVPYIALIVDDNTDDRTYEALRALNRSNWKIFRNRRKQGINRLVHTLCFAYNEVIASTGCELVLKMDQDALMIKQGIVTEALEFAKRNPRAGLFGIYEVDYDRPREFSTHRRLIDRETAWYRAIIGRQPSWIRFLEIAERNGYIRGDNVFGGSYFITRNCLLAAKKLGALDVPWHWHSALQEDVYFSMVTIASGFRLGHFAAPKGHLCMDWRGLPFPAEILSAGNFQLVHSVDKGKNTGPKENGGKTARQVFRDLRNVSSAAGQTMTSS